MPTLIVDQPNRHFGGRITGKVLIGRLPTNGVPLTDSSVSRLHAWVAPDGAGRFFVADTGSLTGTWVNGTAIARRRDLVDGDVIRVGKTLVTFLESDMVPIDVEEADLSGQPLVGEVADVGVLFDCPCGAPAWFKSTAIGHNHHCRQCERTVRIPDRSGVVAEEIDAPKISEPGVPPETAPPADDPHNPMLIHEPEAGDLRMIHDEHGLADSGVHHAVTEPELHPTQEALPVPVGSGIEELSLEEVTSAGSGLDLLAEPTTTLQEAEPVEVLEPEPVAEVTPVEEAPPPPMKPSLFEGRPPRMETIATEPDADDVLDLSAAETTQTFDPPICSVCHSAIGAGEQQTTCPSCGLTFHEECWTENLGCSAYGCPQVDVLKPKEEVATEPDADAVVMPGDAPMEVEEDAGFPWEFIFLLVGVLGALMGALCYGVPAMIGLVGTLIYVLGLQDSKRRRPVAWIAVFLCLVGVGVGVYVSFLYWKGWPPIGPWVRSLPAAHVPVKR